LLLKLCVKHCNGFIKVIIENLDFNEKNQQNFNAKNRQNFNEKNRQNFNAKLESFDY
jgi:hypothetical protein